MTSKERAELKARAMKLDSIFQVGKSSLTPQLVDAIKAALKTRELIKINVLKNCMDDPREIAMLVSERTGSQVVQVIGKKIVLYKKNFEREEKKKRAQKQLQKKKAAQNARRNSAKRVWTKEDSLKRKRENNKKKEVSKSQKSLRRTWDE